MQLYTSEWEVSLGHCTGQTVKVYIGSLVGSASYNYLVLARYS